MGVGDIEAPNSSKTLKGVFKVWEIEAATHERAKHLHTIKDLHDVRAVEGRTASALAKVTTYRPQSMATLIKGVFYVGDVEAATKPFQNNINGKAANGVFGVNQNFN